MFLLGIMIYHMMSNMRGCNMTVEGQISPGMPSPSPPPSPSPSPSPSSGLENLPTMSSSEQTVSTNESLDTILKNIENIFDKDKLDTKTIYNNIIDPVQKITGKNVISTTDFTNIKSISDIGFSDNIKVLDGLELLIINFINMSNDDAYNKIKENMYKGKNDKFCSEEINIYIMAFFMTLYTKSSKLTGSDYSNVLNISNRLTKYIPDFLEKIQDTLNEKCSDNSVNYDSLKQDVLSKIYKTLLQNNITNISFTGLDQISKKLENVKTIYIVLFMLCFTFIIVKFMGMFAMKLNV